MKLFAFVFLLSVFSNVHARLLNGYATQMQDYTKSFHALTFMLKNNDLSVPQKRKIKERLNQLANFISYYDLTNQLLLQLETISPDLYRSVDRLKNLHGRETDVYVKLIDKESTGLPLMGASYFSQHPANADVAVSEYGEYSVSIEIWLLRDSLKILYHELGHVSYVVPNLATYTRFYRRRYHGSDLNFFGHADNDQSGTWARTYEARYTRDYTRYLRAGGNRFDSILTQFEQLTIAQKTSLISFLPGRSNRDHPKHFNN